MILYNRKFQSGGNIYTMFEDQYVTQSDNTNQMPANIREVQVQQENEVAVKKEQEKRELERRKMLRKLMTGKML